VPTPGVDGAALQQMFANMKGTVFGMFNLFSGGAFEKFSIFALGVMPYISASIIVQLLTVVFPQFHELQKEGDQGRKKLTQYTRYLTVVLCFIQGLSIATGLEAASNPPVVLHPGFAFKAMTTITLTAGTIFLMWVGEQMSERGIGNGTSVLIFAGIAAGIPKGFGSTLAIFRTGELSGFKLAVVALAILVTFFVIIFVERGTRRVPVQYVKRVVGRQVYGGQDTHLPLKVNTSGVIPPIFASSLLFFPATIATFFPKNEWIQKITSQLVPGGMIYNVLFVGLIVFFAYFYTAVTFKTEDVSDNLKKYGGFIPGIRPGQPTAHYIDHILSRITLGGAVYISVICVMPSLMNQFAQLPFYFGGTSVLILVGVAMDTVAQIETYLLTHNYDGFLKHTRLKGRTVNT
jgi:preprotein translocase subunit SecY